MLSDAVRVQLRGEASTVGPDMEGKAMTTGSCDGYRRRRLYRCGCLGDVPVPSPTVGAGQRSGPDNVDGSGRPAPCVDELAATLDPRNLQEVLVAYLIARLVFVLSNDGQALGPISIGNGTDSTHVTDAIAELLDAYVGLRRRPTKPLMERGRPE